MPISIPLEEINNELTEQKEIEEMNKEKERGREKPGWETEKEEE